MNKIKILLAGILLSVSVITKADEGMWLPILIKQNMATMTKMGLKLSAQDIYNINTSSVKDAIVALDHGNCTGELISSQGLILTNHHCGYGEIQAHSSPEHDYLTDGFWAMSKKEELPNPGKTVSFLIRVEDVTKDILSQIPEGTDQVTRNKIVDSVAHVLSEKATKGTHYDANVESMFKGNFYYLFVYETFKDIRLVGAPPESIGKFGSDTDNWMWPRHTGDFSMFRVYCGKDGKPAEYSEDNVPLKPKHFLPISLNGVKKDDFAFIMGYPGHTSRYMTSYELKYVMDFENANRVKIRGLKQDIWKKDMDKDTKVRIQYASKHARSANYWKYSLVQNKALKRLKVYDQKVQLEKDFMNWVNKDDKRKAKYGNALNLIKQAYEANTKIKEAQQYLMETQLRGAESFIFAYRLSRLEKALDKKTKKADRKDIIASSRKKAKAFFKDYNAPTDEKATKALLKMYIANVDAKYQPDYIANILNKEYNGDVDKYVDYLFDNSMFVNEDKLNKFLDKPNKKQLEADPIMIASKSILSKYRGLFSATYEGDLKEQEGMRLFVGGLLKMNPKKLYAPDANSTMRLTYGSVGDYKPADGVHYSHFTTMKGIMEKEDPDVREFNVPAKLKELYKNKDFGQYANADGTMPVCFTTNNDITGGNSGSPVINGKGQLIGTAFDGNSEAMSGDIAFEHQMQKCINVDIRYVLFVIDKYAGAKNLIEEMKIIKD